MILQGLLWLLLILVLGVVAVLALPVRLRVVGRTQPERWVRVELGLLGGLVPRFAVFDSVRSGGGEAPPDQPAAPKPGRRRKRGTSGKRRGRRMIRAAPRLLQDLLRQVRIERLDLDGCFGLGDPAETGQVFGMLAPLAYGGGWMLGPGARLAVTPVFDRACLEGRGDVMVAVVPLALVPPAIRFAWAVFGPRR
ncbi:DUF2953 domain-containing protein [Psychromarinibacter sp. C21-152]|uniref:DUF2953 domain-containing protein n=1 Tax=Psychromarinibacter sediminicola TaxID=3033385 RepID=A0AAE3NSA8_9RHOB|nr:DUF2953 domain-containing protein [Psychromarinibacter sediminicola]MDF0601521.1 DUF2953 domain-containing protein [Psychromarinibacter sediminicola]